MRKIVLTFIIVVVYAGAALSDEKQNKTPDKYDNASSGESGDSDKFDIMKFYRENMNAHQGLLFRLLINVALGLGKTTVTGFNEQPYTEANDIELKGNIRILRFQLGYAFKNGLILYGEYGGFTMSEPDIKLGGVDQNNTRSEYVIQGPGIGISYYFMPINIYVTAGYSRMMGEIKSSIIKTEEIQGNGLFAAAGKEWMVWPGLGIGFSVYYYYGKMKTDDPDFQKQYDITDHRYGIAFSATFN